MREYNIRTVGLLTSAYPVLTSALMSSSLSPVPVQPDRLFYDGSAASATGGPVRGGPRSAGTAFRFAPLGGPTFPPFSPSARSQLPDSIVVRTADGRTLTRWPAVLHIGQKAGGLSARLAEAAGCCRTGWEIWPTMRSRFEAALRCPD
jgi:hypothetical protein